MNTRHLNSYLPPLFIITLLGIVGCLLSGCETGSSASSKTLANYGNSFTINVPGPDHVDYFKDNGATENAARQAVQMELASRGYDYHGSGPTSFAVDMNWISSVNNTANSGQTAVSQAAPDISTRYITLAVTAKDPVTGDVIWKSEPILPVGPIKTFSLDNAAAMARKAVQNFPAYPASSAR
jgi:hypothetical protein